MRGTLLATMSTTHSKEALCSASSFNKQGDFSRAIEDYNFALMKDQQCTKAKVKAKAKTSPTLSATTTNNNSHNHGMTKPQSSSMVLGIEAYAKLREKELLDKMTQRKQQIASTSTMSIQVSNYPIVS